MIRLQIIFAVLFLSHALTGYFAYNYAKGKQAIVENNILETSIKHDNDNKKQIEKHTKQVENTRIIYRDRIAKVGSIHITDAPSASDCHLRDDSTGLRNNIYRSFPKMYFEGAEQVPDATP